MNNDESIKSIFSRRWWETVCYTFSNYERYRKPRIFADGTLRLNDWSGAQDQYSSAHHVVSVDLIKPAIRALGGIEEGRESLEAATALQKFVRNLGALQCECAAAGRCLCPGSVLVGDLLAEGLDEVARSSLLLEVLTWNPGNLLTGPRDKPHSQPDAPARTVQPGTFDEPIHNLLEDHKLREINELAVNLKTYRDLVARPEATAEFARHFFSCNHIIFRRGVKARTKARLHCLDGILGWKEHPRMANRWEPVELDDADEFPDRYRGL